MTFRNQMTQTVHARSQARWWIHIVFALAAVVVIEVLFPAAVYDSTMHSCGTSEAVAVSLLWILGSAYVIALLLAHLVRMAPRSKAAARDRSLDGTPSPEA
jgi:hypothetical protein